MSALIRFEQVSKHHQMGGVEVRALDGVDLRIDSGDFLAIVGPSGSGKSTLMHLLGFLDRPTRGHIYLRDRELSDLSANQRATVRGQEIGFVFQAFNLLPRLDVMANVLLPLSYNRKGVPNARDRAWELLDEVGMRDRAHHRPSQLSGGQRQRVAIARALINDPLMILADEPTGNLDSSTARTILELFQRLNRSGRTIVLVTHDAAVAAYSQRQIHVLDGRITETKKAMGFS